MYLGVKSRLEINLRSMDLFKSARRDVSVRGHGGLIDTVYTVVRRLSRTKPEARTTIELATRLPMNETKESELLT